MRDDVSHKVALGKGWHNTGTTVASADYDANYEGSMKWGEDLSRLDSAGLPRKRRSQRGVLRILVRNTAALKLLPKRLVRWESGQEGKRVDGYVRLSPNTGVLGEGEVAGVVDEHWPSAGVPVGELFWLAVVGPALCLTDIAATAANGEISVGDPLVALTAATSGATTAGRVGVWEAAFTGNTAGLTAAFCNQYIFGRALSAKTSANTNADVLVDMNCWIG